MSSPALKSVPQVNLDEFERRLRTAATPQPAQDDPLAELARIVGLDSPPDRRSENVVTLPSRSSSTAELDYPSREPLIRVSFGAPSAIEPPALRPAFDEIGSPAADHVEDMAIPTAEELVEPDTVHDELRYAPTTPRRAKGRRLALTLLASVGVVCLGVAGALKYGALPGLHKTPPVIMASDAPTKVAPPSTNDVAPPNDTATVLFKDAPARPASVKMVTSEEQPVDLHAQVADAPPAPAAVASIPAPASPIVANPDAPLVAPADVAQSGATVASPLFAEPKRVKTVSVRPDGTLITAAADPSPAASATRSIPVIPAPAPDTSADLALPQPSTPKVDLPIKPHAKSTARVQVGKSDTAGVASDPPLELGPPTKLEKAAKTARAKPAAPADTSPTQVASAVDTTTTETAPTSPAPSPASGGGGYTVQLAAPTTTGEANSAITRLKTKYAGELNGLEPTIHKADLAQGTVYRIRVGDLSKAEAIALCEKLKSGGGACFVAKN